MGLATAAQPARPAARAVQSRFDSVAVSAEVPRAMATRDHGRFALAGALLAAALASGCRRPALLEAAPPPAPGDREQLLARIVRLDEVAPCLTDSGAAGVRLVDAELAGDAAMAFFACANGAASGKVTFFRIAGTWTVSTKEIRSAARPAAQATGRSTTPVPASASTMRVAPSAR
jgi:hypothetical protein